VRADVIVVGAGIMGCATARVLARAGRDVELVEQFRVGHARGSSHGRSRIFRLAYPELEWVRLAEESLRGWRELEQESGTTLLELNGLLELVADPARTSHEALSGAGVDFEVLDAEQTRARWPIALPDGWSALHQPEAGIVRADLAQRAFLDSAVTHGARLKEQTRIETLDDVDAEVVVLTAGAWIAKLVRDVAVEPSRETVAYFRREGAPVPSVGELDPETRDHVMFALHDPDHGLKAGVHHGGRTADPDSPGEPDRQLVERIAEWVAQTFPDADPEPAATDTCLYTNTPDERFVLERRGRIVIGSACSGHAFKFAPAVGDRLARLALDIL